MAGSDRNLEKRRREEERKKKKIPPTSHDTTTDAFSFLRRVVPVFRPKSVFSVVFVPVSLTQHYGHHSTMPSPSTSSSPWPPPPSSLPTPPPPPPQPGVVVTESHVGVFAMFRRRRGGVIGVSSPASASASASLCCVVLCSVCGCVCGEDICSPNPPTPVPIGLSSPPPRRLCILPVVQHPSTAAGG